MDHGTVVTGVDGVLVLRGGRGTVGRLTCHIHITRSPLLGQFYKNKQQYQNLPQRGEADSKKTLDANHHHKSPPDKCIKLF